MINIELKYRPITFLKWKKSATGKHPESWKELTPSQLKAVAYSFKKTPNEFEFLSVMTGIKKKIIRKLDDFQRYNLTVMLEFIKDFQPFHSFIISHLDLEEERFYAPESMLKNMPFAQCGIHSY